MTGVRKIMLAGFLVLAGAWSVFSEPPADEQELNRQALEKARLDPEHYEHLRQEMKDFLQLPADEQARLRQLDRDLRNEPSVTYVRLHRVLERYHAWLENLSESERQIVDSAPDPRERLQRVKQVREKQWISRLPQAYRDQIDQASSDRRPALIQQFRQQEYQRRQEWQVALGHWDELLQGSELARLQGWPEGVRTFFNEHLKDRLTSAEQKQLQEAEGKWPEFPQTLVALADNHPLALPGPVTGPKRFQDLPPDLQESLRAALDRAQKARPNFHPGLKPLEGKWPEFAIRVAEVSTRLKVPMKKQLGPSQPREFTPLMQNFIEHELKPMLTAEEKKTLGSAENQWPRYPRTLSRLANEHQLRVPGMALPGPAKAWDKFRAKAELSKETSPEVTDKALRDFAQKELGPKEQREFRSFPMDPAARERLKQEYFKRNPNVLKELHQSDMKKRQKQIRKPGPG